jgi:hypothetical protein
VAPASVKHAYPELTGAATHTQTNWWPCAILTRWRSRHSLHVAGLLEVPEALLAPSSHTKIEDRCTDTRRDAGRFADRALASPCDAFEYPSRERHVRRAPDVSFLERPRVNWVSVPYQLKQA